MNFIKDIALCALIYLTIFVTVSPSTANEFFEYVVVSW